jgi:glycosyltransferase involved in cell wall biosynthesis
MRVSVIINNYNYDRFVGCAIDSALQQSYENVEVIVVDDGSLDGSLTVVREYASAITLVAKTNGGQGSAYNSGFERATGEIVIFLDADDWLYPNAVAEVAAGWRAGASKVQFRLALVNEKGEPLGRYVPRSMHDRDALKVLREFGTYGSPPGSGNAFASEFLQAVMPMDERIWQTAADTVPIMLAPMYGEVISLAKTLGAYRLHRRTGEKELLLNNAPQGLWQEFERIKSTKGFVEAQLVQRALPVRTPLLMAPWECRIIAMCIRFGGDAPDAAVPSASKLLWFTLVSIWRWPDWGWIRKFLLSGWTVLLLCMPSAVAQRLALKHRLFTGQADTSAQVGSNRRRSTPSMGNSTKR